MKEMDKNLLVLGCRASPGGRISLLGIACASLGQSFHVKAALLVVWLGVPRERSLRQGLGAGVDVGGEPQKQGRVSEEVRMGKERRVQGHLPSCCLVPQALLRRVQDASIQNLL